MMRRCHPSPSHSVPSLFYSVSSSSSLLCSSLVRSKKCQSFFFRKNYHLNVYSTTTFLLLLFFCFSLKSSGVSCSSDIIDAAFGIADDKNSDSVRKFSKKFNSGIESELKEHYPQHPKIEEDGGFRRSSAEYTTAKKIQRDAREQVYDVDTHHLKDTSVSRSLVSSTINSNKSNSNRSGLSLEAQSYEKNINVLSLVFFMLFQHHMDYAHALRTFPRVSKRR